MEQYFPIQAEGTREAALKVLQNMPLPCEVSIQPLRHKRSSAQNRLYWKWLSEIASQYTTPDGKKFSKDEWHHLCGMKFIGVKIIQLGGREFPLPSKSTKDLKVAEFSEYLLNIESEFLQKGVSLTFTDDYGLAIGMS